MERCDVAVVGAGTAGAVTAWECARRGMRVLCLDAGPLAEAGARWVNAVAGWCFDAAGVARPEPPEYLGGDAALHLVAGWDGPAVTLTGHDVAEVDMRALVARLQRDAAAAGAALRGGVRVRAWEDGVLRTGAGPIAADFVVDASGLGGSLGLHPRPPAVDLCVASQQVYRIADMQAAAAFCRRHGAALGDGVCFSGVAGGFSIVAFRTHGDRVAVLAGSIPALGHPPGTVLVERFARAHAWIGPRLFGGARAIPVRSPHLRLVVGRAALVGDAACQVFAAHGSGIGAGMIAARLVAEALEAGEPDRYEVAWHRGYGGRFAASSLFARYASGLDAAAFASLIDAGFLRRTLVAAMIEQRQAAPTARDVVAIAAAAARSPWAVRRLGPVVARMAALEALYRRFPRRASRRPAWRGLHDRVLPPR